MGKRSKAAGRVAGSLSEGRYDIRSADYNSESRTTPRAAMRTTWVMAAVCSVSITAACMLVLT